MKTYTREDFPLGTPIASENISPDVLKHLAIDEIQNLSFFVTKVLVSSVDVCVYNASDALAVPINDQPVSWGAIGLEGRENHSRSEKTHPHAISPWRTDIRLKVNLKKGEGRALIEAKLPVQWNATIPSGEIIDLIAAQGDGKAILIAAFAPASSKVVPLCSVPQRSNLHPITEKEAHPPSSEVEAVEERGEELAAPVDFDDSNEEELPPAPDTVALQVGVTLSMCGIFLIFVEVFFLGFIMLVIGALGLALHSRDKAEYNFKLSQRQRVLQKKPAAIRAQEVTPEDEVTIGTQVWMSKNLDVSTFRNGDPIPEAKTADEWREAGRNRQPAWSYYNNDPANGARYGKLYNWYAVSDSRGLAPEGWHIPTDAEWSTLENYLGNDAGNKMKSTSGWRDGGNGTNSSGFSGLPGGGRYGIGAFDYVGGRGYWWSSTEDDSGSAWLRSLDYYFGSVNRNNYFKHYGLSVRCLRD